jgi:hypothetical protein
MMVFLLMEKIDVRDFFRSKIPYYSFFEKSFRCLLIVILTFMSFTLSNVSFPNIYALPIVILSSLFILLEDPIDIYIFERIGNLSYSIYLYHWPLICGLSLVFFRSTEPYSEMLFYFVFIISLYYISTLSYDYIEQPTLKLDFTSLQWLLISFFMSVFLVVSFSTLSGLQFGAHININNNTNNIIFNNTNNGTNISSPIPNSYSDELVNRFWANSR